MLAAIGATVVYFCLVIAMAVVISNICNAHIGWCCAITQLIIAFGYFSWYYYLRFW